MSSVTVQLMKVFLQDMPGAPGMKMYSREDLMRDPRLMDSSSNVDEDEDEDEDVDEDEDESTLEKNRFVRASNFLM